MRKEGKELVFRRVRVDQLVTQCDVARFVFYKIEHALDRLVRRL